MMVRALTFRKRFAKTNQGERWWAILGHSDEMECSDPMPLTLENIKKNNDALYKLDSGSTYHHVIYLIDSDTNKEFQASDEDIWNTDMDFLSVTRIHFPNALDLYGQYERLDQYFSKLATNPEYESISWRTYYSMELSDMVLISKSRKLHTLSQWSLLATKTWLAGSTYTYFCIPNLLLEKDCKAWSGRLRDDYVDFMAIRFAVQGEGADSILFSTQKCLGEDYASIPFRVVGNEDAIICCNNVPVRNLLKLYRSLYQDTQQVLKTFRDIITRVGTVWNGIPPKNEELGNAPTETVLEVYSKKVLEKVRIQVLPKTAKSLQDRAWLRPLVEITNALVHMSHFTSLNELVFLVLPAIDAFWENVLNDSEPLLDDALYLRFAELCSHTMEHLMRAEGQLSHRPEIRPLTFDLPIVILEYATAFLLTLSCKLSAPDRENSDQIRFLLVPSAEIGVSTEEPFEAKGKKVGLLQTTVPFDLLYRPKLLLPALCHEMAHYVGETLRMRDLRYWCFLNATAIVFTDYFFDHIANNPERFQEFIVNEYLDASLRTSVIEKSYRGETNIVKVPLLTIVDMIGHLVDGTVAEEKYDAYAELIRNYVLSEYCGAQVFGFSGEHLDAQLIPFKRRINDLLMSFRETYADICMLFCLELTPVEYLNVAVHQWDSINSSTLLRVYASLSISGRSLAEIIHAVEVWGQQNKANNQERDWACDELRIIADWVNGEESCAEQYLIDYLAGCWQGFIDKHLDCDETSLGNKYTTKNIYDTIVGINDITSYKDVLEIIDQGRRIALNQFEYST